MEFEQLALGLLVLENRRAIRTLSKRLRRVDPTPRADRTEKPALTD